MPQSSEMGGEQLKGFMRGRMFPGQAWRSTHGESLHWPWLWTDRL